MKRLIVILGVVGVSLSALLVRWSTAPSLIMALYRMVFAAALLTPAALRKERFSGLPRREAGLSVLSGAFLGLHFTCYFEALNRTSIASAVVLVDTEVLFVALASVLILRKKLSSRAWMAVLTAFGGSALVALADRSAGAGALSGDLIALAGAVCVSVYTMLGAVCRERLSTTAYTYLVYLSAAGTLLAVVLGYLLFVLTLRMFYPLFPKTAEDLRYYMELAPTAFPDAAFTAVPQIYYLVAILPEAFLYAFLACFSLYISSCSTNRFVILSAPVIFYYIYNHLSGTLRLPDILAWQAHRTGVFPELPWRQNLLYTAGYYAIWIVFMGILFAGRARRKIQGEC